jgi:riboflavin synthase
MTLRLLQLDMMQYIIPKGSVAIDGISLTVAETYSDSFSVAVIPTTMLLTTLGEKKVGDLLNIETDILARTILSKLNRCSSDDSLRAKLIAGGFVKP